MQLPTLVEMLKAGVHFGHQTGKWHPKMKPFIFTSRSGVHILNLEETTKRLKKASEFVHDIAKQGGTILFVGTKKQTQELVVAHATACHMPYITERWVGGLLTNFSVVKQNIKQYKTLKEQQESGGWDKYTKKERLDLTKKFERLERFFCGLVGLEALPAAVVLIDMRREKTALREARKQHIPLVALCDTNTNPTLIDYPIPANDDAVKGVDLMLRVLSEAINEGRKEKEEKTTSHDQNKVDTNKEKGKKKS